MLALMVQMCPTNFDLSSETMCTVAYLGQVLRMGSMGLSRPDRQRSDLGHMDIKWEQWDQNGRILLGI